MFNLSSRFLLRALLTIGLMFSIFALTPSALAAATSDFTLRSTDGRNVSLNSLRGRVVVLAFGASWLPLSRAQIGEVQKLADAYASQIEVFWVSTDSDNAKSKNFASDEQLKTFAAKHGLRAGVLRDPDAAVSKSLGVDQLPAVVIFDREGNVSGAPLGGLDPNANLAETLAARLKSLL